MPEPVAHDVEQALVCPAVARHELDRAAPPPGLELGELRQGAPDDIGGRHHRPVGVRAVLHQLLEGQMQLGLVHLSGLLVRPLVRPLEGRRGLGLRGTLLLNLSERLVTAYLVLLLRH